jgi:glycosyltransferase involved in cell wall biosynthesis
MKDNPLVSIILTSFNHEKYLREAIDSVLNQAFTDFELIIWDDASSDNSWDVINQYADPRIMALRNDEQKRGTWGLNKAISEVASGKYIAIHHSDDVWETEKLEKQVTFLNEHPEFGAVFTNITAIGEDSKPLKDENNFYFSIFEQPNRTRFEWLNFFFNRGNALCHPSVLIRKSCYADCGLYRFGLAQIGDFDMWIRLCLQYEIHVLPEKLVKFRVRDNEANASGNQPETRIRGMYELCKTLEHYKKIKKFDDLAKIFPSAVKYDRKEETDVDFVLGMVALEEKPFIFTQLFGLDLLFEVISDPVRSENIKRLYDFDYKSFIDLTAKHDVFSREEVSTLWGTVTERDRQIASLNQAVGERNGQIASLGQVVHSLTETVAQRDAAVAERDAALAAVVAIRHSTSWRLTALLRLLGYLIKGYFPAVGRSVAYIKKCMGEKVIS